MKIARHSLEEPRVVSGTMQFGQIGQRILEDRHFRQGCFKLFVWSSNHTIGVLSVSFMEVTMGREFASLIKPLIAKAGRLNRKRYCLKDNPRHRILLCNKGEGV